LRTDLSQKPVLGIKEIPRTRSCETVESITTCDQGWILGEANKAVVSGPPFSEIP